MIYSADRVATIFGGYFAALGLLPFALGAILGLLGAWILGKGLKKSWWLPVAGILAAFVPVAFAIIAMSRPEVP